MIHFEHLGSKVLPRREFARRLMRNFTAATLLVVVSLLLGIVGYHTFEQLPWIDSFANASMILSGMGPLGELKHWNGKLFAGFYALYSGLVLVAVIGIILAPIIHRALHRFHAAEDDKS
ncbi:MAG TPA: hypothetical protein VHV77_10760 [Pirellulales bacterium]|nr:hypothetical protein [Pirellulales bacterium]